MTIDALIEETSNIYAYLLDEIENGQVIEVNI